MKEPDYKRYMCFGLIQYYPSGGLGDVEESFDTIEEAREWVKLVEEIRALDETEIFDRIEGVSVT